MGESVEVRVGKRRTLVIPKRVAEALGIREGSRLILEVKEGFLVVKPVPDAIHLSLHGEKIARVTLKELEEVSIDEQERAAAQDEG